MPDTTTLPTAVDTAPAIEAATANAGPINPNPTPKAIGEELASFLDTLAGIFSRTDALAQPGHVIAHAQALGAVWAVVFIVVGVICLVNGYKFYKAAIIGLALLTGMIGGYWFGGLIGSPFIVAICLGLLLAVVAFPLMKYAVAVFGGIAGAFAGANLWAGSADAINRIAARSSGTAEAAATIPSNAYWIGALVGLLVCGMLAFILFKLSVEVLTAVGGATIAVIGVIALLLGHEPWRDAVAAGLQSSQFVIPMLVFVPAIIGLILQESRSGGRRADLGTA
jgi:hypothetical protein